MSSPTEPQSARDRFIEVLRSRSMMRPSEEWVIDANLAAYAEELADRLRAHGHHDAADLIDPGKAVQL